MQARDASAAEPKLLATDESSWYSWWADLPSVMMMVIAITGMRVQRSRRVVRISGYELGEILLLGQCPLGPLA
jgi:hypothetical protein